MALSPPSFKSTASSPSRGMRIWLDACTGKHVRYATAIARELRARGHEVVLTTREHPDTVALAKALGEDFIVVGRYSPGDRTSKLVESARRTVLLAEMFADEAHRPDVAICHQSVELCRVAFGLGVPVLCTSDSPHARAVGRLTIPLADVVVLSAALPEEPYRAMGARRIVRFQGVDEVAWALRPGLKAPEETLAWLEELERPVIVVREEEYGAAYSRSPGRLMWGLARALSTLGTVVFLPRYERPKECPEGVVIPSGFVDGLLLVSKADLVVGAGGTLCREAALQGTPTIVVPYLDQPIYVNAFLAERGFPIFEAGPEPGDVLRRAEELVGRRWDVREALGRLEDPVALIIRLAEELGQR